MGTTIQQVTWRKMCFRQHALVRLMIPGRKKAWGYYRIILPPKEQFTVFRTRGVGKPGGLERLTSERSSSSWRAQSWLISKTAAHIEGNHLIADSKDVADLIQRIGTQPILENSNATITKVSTL